MLSKLKPKKSNNGFTIIEILVVAGIIIFMTVSLITSFPRTRISLNEDVKLLVSNIRSAQTKAISSTKFNNKNPCGYGIKYDSPTQYSVYVGTDAEMAGTACAAVSKNYQSGQDSILSAFKLSANLQFTAQFADIFFEPPDPKTYFNNDGTLNTIPTAITLKKTGGACPNDCKTINVYKSGKIEIQ